jgi:citrate lyase subunit beta / citryl-CoA lyase
MRSFLFIPGDSDRKQAKALASGSDALILDLEDSVAPSRKAAAREMTRAFLQSNAPLTRRPRLLVRINSLETPYWADDLTGVMAGRPDAILLPKPRNGEDVQRLSVALDHAEAKVGSTIGITRIFAIATEVPISVLSMASYVDSSARLEGLTWGAEDLGLEVGASANRRGDSTWTSPFQLARDMTLFTATSAKVQPIDTVFVNFRDLTGLEREAREAARDGFTGKMAIHPDQVATINAAFTPTAEAVSRAQAIIALFAANPGSGALNMDGHMVDIPHLRQSERILARAKLASKLAAG